MKVLINHSHNEPPPFVIQLARYLEKEGAGAVIMVEGPGQVTYKKEGLRYFPVSGFSNRKGTLLKFLSALFRQLRSPSGYYRFYSIFNRKRGLFRKQGRRFFFETFIRYSYISTYKPDIIFNCWLSDLPSLEPFMEEKGIHVVNWLAGTQENVGSRVFPAFRTMLGRVLHKLSGYHSISEETRENIIAAGGDPKKMRILPPAVESFLLDFPEKEKFKNKKVNIISVGRFHWKKGYYYSIEALRLAREDGLDFHYSLVANGDPVEALFQIKEAGLEDVITIYGGLSQEEVYEKISRADLFIYPSVEEGMGIAVIEALALGTPVIVSEGIGTVEIIQNEVTGWLTPLRNPQMLKEKILEVKNKPEKEIEKVIDNGRNLVREKLTWETSIKQILDFFEAAKNGMNE